MDTEKRSKLKILGVSQHPARANTYVCTTTVGLLVIGLGRSPLQAAIVNPTWGPSYVMTIDSTNLTKAAVRVSERPGSISNLASSSLSAGVPYHPKQGKYLPLNSNAVPLKCHLKATAVAIFSDPFARECCSHRSLPCNGSAFTRRHHRYHYQPLFFDAECPIPP